MRTTTPYAFDEWMLKVKKAVMSKVGLSHEDLPDQPYWDWFASGITPSVAASRAIRYAKEN